MSKAIFLDFDGVLNTKYWYKNATIDKYGLERVYDRVREMHYSLECRESKMRLEQLLKENK